jgi:hypothetical protein
MTNHISILRSWTTFQFVSTVLRFESFGEVEGFRSQLSVVGVARLSGNSILELLKEKVVSYNLLSVKKEILQFN